MPNENLNDLDTATLEAMSRKNEVKSELLTNRGDEDGKLGELESEARTIRDILDERAGTTPVVDLEGTAQVLSDANGNFPDNAEQSAAGGIGIKNSNTVSPEQVEEEKAKIADLAAANPSAEIAAAGGDPAELSASGSGGGGSSPTPAAPANPFAGGKAAPKATAKDAK